MGTEKPKSKAVATLNDTANLPIKFGEDEIALIKQNITPGASEAEFNLFLYDCQSRGLNPLRKEIYWIKRGDKATHQTGIDGFRKVAQSTGEYEGQTSVEYGQVVKLFGKDVPEYAEVGVWRKGFKEALKGRAYFAEYAQTYGSKLGNMWEKMPRLMIAKCAEALALRKAFPAELSGLYTSDEMSQANNEAPKATVREINPSTGEIKEEVTPKTAVTPAFEPCTRTHEAEFNALMCEYQTFMGWDGKKLQEMTMAVLKNKKAEEISDEAMVKLIKTMTDNLAKKKADRKIAEVQSTPNYPPFADQVKKEPMPIEEVANFFDGEIIS